MLHFSWLCYSLWLFHLHSAVKIRPFSPAFPLAEPVAPEQDVTTAVETMEVPMAKPDLAEETSPEAVEAPAEPVDEPEVEKAPNADQLFEAIQQDAKGEDKE